MPLAGLTTFRATREHSTPSPIGISHLASQVGISHHYTNVHNGGLKHHHHLHCCYHRVNPFISPYAGYTMELIELIHFSHPYTGYTMELIHLSHPYTGYAMELIHFSHPLHWLYNGVNPFISPLHWLCYGVNPFLSPPTLAMVWS